jgi:TolA-binding protein
VVSGFGLGKLASWIGVGLVGGALLVGGAAYTTSSSPPPDKMRAGAATTEGKAFTSSLLGQRSGPIEGPAQPAPAQESPEITPAPVQVPAAGAEREAKAATALPRAPRERAAVPSATQPPVAEAVRNPEPVAARTPINAGPEALERETKLLDGARRALRSGDSERAARELEEHGRRFSGGALAPEAEVMRIELLLARGDRAGAAARARNFLAQHPVSPHAGRVRAVLSAATQP